MADYEFTSAGVVYPHVTLEDVRTFMEAEAQGIIPNPWDELRVMVAQHASTKVEVRFLHGRQEGPDGPLLMRHVLVRVDTDEVVDEFDVAFPLPTTPAEGARVIAEGVV